MYASCSNFCFLVGELPNSDVAIVSYVDCLDGNYRILDTVQLTDQTRELSIAVV